MIDLINTNYDIVWAHPVSSPKDWQFFLLEESHSNALARRTNGLFISASATPGSIFLVESHKYLENVNNSNLQLKIFQIQTKNISNIMGWDKSNEFEEKAPYIFSYGTAADILMEIRNDTNILETICWKKTLNNCFKNQGSEENSYFDGPISEIAEEMQKFFNEKVIPLTHKIKKLRNKGFEFEKKKLQKENELDNILYEKILELLDSKLNLIKYSNNDFSERTSCMIQTIDSIEKIITSSGAFAYLIAGGSHLEEPANRPAHEQERCSLKSFYEFLASYKNIVILKPKCLKS